MYYFGLFARVQLGRDNRVAGDDPRRADGDRDAAMRVDAAGRADMRDETPWHRADQANAFRAAAGARRAGTLKRAFDVVGSAALLVLLMPLLLTLAALVAASGGRPIFAHRRVGRGGRPFMCLKFRTMVHGAEKLLPDILARDPVAAAEWARDHKLTNDPRVTVIGDFLRRSSLDELPQLYNVLVGEMSFVGPRPVTEAELRRYGPHAAAYASVRPGLTGLWQVGGRNEVSYDERIALDVRYATRNDMSGDLVIIAWTIVSMLRLTGK